MVSYSYIPLLLSAAKLKACFTEIKLKSHFGNKSFFGWLGFSQSFNKDSGDEVAMEEPTVVADATFMSHNNPEIS